MTLFNDDFERSFDKQFNSVKRYAIGVWLFGAAMTTLIVGTGIYLLIKNFG